jgi:hypothetical protein
MNGVHSIVEECAGCSTNQFFIRWGNLTQVPRSGLSVHLPDHCAVVRFEGAVHNQREGELRKRKFEYRMRG